MLYIWVMVRCELDTNIFDFCNKKPETNSVATYQSLAFFIVHNNRSHPTDVNWDQHKNPGKINVWSAIKSPKYITSVSNVSTNNSRPSSGDENSCVGDLRMIPTSNVGEGHLL